jgi:parallel beta-helix repeat protein
MLLGAMGASAVLLAGIPASADHKVPGVCEVPREFPTLQAAIDDTSCLTVHAAWGTFTEQLTITRSLTLAGSGERHSYIQAPATMTEPKAIIRVIGRRVRVKIKHFTLQGPGANFGVLLEKDSVGTLTNVIISDIREEPMGSGAGFVGVQSGVPGAVQISKLVMANCTVENYQGAAVLIQGQGTIGTISYSVFKGSGDRPAGTPAPTGIIVRDGAVATVSRSDIDDNRAHPASGVGVGVLFDGTGLKTQLLQNNVDRNDVGVHVVNTTRAIIYRNGVDHSTGDGIVLQDSDDNDLTRNRVVNAGGTGIRLSASDKNTVYGNETLTGGDGGVALESSANNVLLGNRAENNVGYGMTDDSTGTKTAKTANTWQRSNLCNGNTLGDSSPAGLCQ